MKNYKPEMKSELHCRWIEADETLDRELIVHDSNSVWFMSSTQRQELYLSCVMASIP